MVCLNLFFAINVYKFLSSHYPKKTEITQRKYVKFIPLRGIQTAIFLKW